MLEVLSKIICFLIAGTTGFVVLKMIIKSDVKLFSKRSIFYLILLAIIQMSMHKVQYTITYTLTVFLLNIIVYKNIFKLNLERAILSCCIFTVIFFFSDFLISITVGCIIPPEQARSASLIAILINALIGLLTYIIASTKIITTKIQKFYNITSSKKIMNIIFFILIIIDFTYIAYNLMQDRNFDFEYISNLIAMVIFAIVVLIYIENKNNYHQLSIEYDSLFNYVQHFEDWIEKEQLNRHEYKNQLAVLRCLTKEKKVKSKINEILEDNINIEGQVVHQLKELPKGGLKGLMYYKAAIAQKRNVKLEVDIILEKNSVLNKLTEEKIKVLCKLIGIYFDNAIEAAMETKEKTVLLEIYEIKNKVNIVISNSFIKHKNFDKRNNRGVSTKGEGHGNGLYFANNIISKNKWITSKQETIEKYYIQTLIIKS